MPLEKKSFYSNNMISNNDQMNSELNDLNTNFNNGYIPDSSISTPALLNVHPFDDDPVYQIVYELQGLNYAWYEGLATLDKNAHTQFNYIVHECIWSAVEILGIPNHNVYTYLAPGLITAICLKHKPQEHSMMYDAQWPLRVHVTVKLTDEYSQKSLKRALLGYSQVHTSFQSVRQYYENIFGIVELFKLRIIDPYENYPTWSGETWSKIICSRKNAEENEYRNWEETDPTYWLQKSKHNEKILESRNIEKEYYGSRYIDCYYSLDDHRISNHGTNIDQIVDDDTDDEY